MDTHKDLLNLRGRAPKAQVPAFLQIKGTLIYILQTVVIAFVFYD